MCVRWGEEGGWDFSTITKCGDSSSPSSSSYKASSSTMISPSQPNHLSPSSSHAPLAETQKGGWSVKRFPKTQTLCTSVAEKALRSAICFSLCSSSESPMKISASMPQNTSSLGNYGQALIDPPNQKGLKRGDMYLRNFPIERPFESTLRNNSWSTAPTRNTLFH